MNADLAKRFWDLQNYVTGFAITQMLVVLITAGTSDGFRIRLHQQWRWVVSAMLVFGCLYTAAVIFAHRAEMAVEPLDPRLQRILCWTVSVRVALLLLVNFVGALIVFLTRNAQ